jgi:hypothetical protein
MQRVARLGRMTTLSQGGVMVTANSPTDQTLTGVTGIFTTGVHVAAGPGWFITGESFADGSCHCAPGWVDRRPILVTGQGRADGYSEVS